MTLLFRIRTGVFATVTCTLALAGLGAPLAQGATPPEELNFSKQKDFSLDATNVSVDEVAVVGADETKQATVVGSISNGNGDIANVTVNGDKVSIGPVESPGKYSGSVNLAPSVKEGQTTKISLSVRDSVGWAAIALAIGLLLAFSSEMWLTRWRPRGQLRKAFLRIGVRLAATADQQTARFSNARTGWVAPRVDGPESMLVRYKERIESGLGNATTDAERERFGPGGDEMKKVDTSLDTYEELLGYGGQITQMYKLLANRLESESIRSEFTSGALVERIGELLGGRTIAGAAELTEMVTEAKDTYLVLHGVTRLDLSYRLLTAKSGVSTAVKEKIALRREQLLHNAASTDDLTAQRTFYGEIAKALYEGGETKTVEVNLPLLASFAIGGTAPAPAEASVPHPGLSAPAPAPVVSSGSPSEASPWSRYLDMGNWAFTVISAAVVFVAGLSALYFSNATFGSINDYLGMLLWGSTVQGGISLVRQVVPGAAKGLAASGE
jgi:hypothetical protein